jgi:hypothetical protein
MKAFPIQNAALPEENHGMDLRDYFAAKVMAASFCNPLEMSLGEMKDTAEAAYLMADAMMKAREK